MMIASAWGFPDLRRIVLTFTTTLTGLAFETLPFLLIGSVFSSVIHVFLPSGALRRIFPRNPFLSILVALSMGAFLPICECASVPLARTLRRHGLPLSSVAAFLLAAPLVNPLTILSTYVAFVGSPRPMYLLRVGLGFIAAFVIAAIVETRTKKVTDTTKVTPAPQFYPLSPSRKRQALLVLPQRRRRSFSERISDTLAHASTDFLDSARYLIAGLCAAAAVRALVPADSLSRALSSPLTAIPVGALAAILLSLCSSADAFVARSIFIPASYPAALTFLILGPMMDLKNSILLSRFVQPRRLLQFIALIVLVCCAVAFAALPLLGGTNG